jgi:hypothetical protein
MGNNRKWLVTVAVVTLLCGSRGWAAEAKTPAELYFAAEFQNNTRSALTLGRLYETGTGGVGGKSIEAALYWYRRAVQIGNAVPAKDMVYNNFATLEACHRLGYLYEYGDGTIAKNLKEAARWYMRAAEKGWAISAYNLGAMYASGYIDPPDDVQGYAWMLIAQGAVDGCTHDPNCRFINNDPPGHMKVLRRRMKASQLDEAQKRANSWRPLDRWRPVDIE